MAVLFITKTINAYPGVTFNQTDPKWSPQRGQTFPAGRTFGLETSEWSSSAVPWKDEGELAVQTKYGFQCVVDSTQADPDNDYLMVTSGDGGTAYTRKIGPTGSGHNYSCTLSIGADGQLTWSDIQAA